MAGDGGSVPKAWEVRDSSTPVMAYYWDSGLAQKTARREWFEYLGLTVTVLHLIWVALEADLNSASSLMEADVAFLAGHWAFCLFFACEATICVSALRSKRDLFAAPLRGLFFDVVLALALLLAGLLSGSVAEVLKLIQLARMWRLLARVPEAMIVVKGLVVASRSVFWLVLLEVAVVYVFANVFRKLSADTSVGMLFFSSVSEGMFSLFTSGLLISGISDLAYALKEESLVMLVLFFLFLVIAFSIIAVLFGVLCEVVSMVASSEKALLSSGHLASGLRGALKSHPSGESLCASEQRFVELLVDPTIDRVLLAHGLDPAELATLAPAIFNHGAPFSSVDELARILSRLSEHGNATFRDLMWLQK